MANIASPFLRPPLLPGWRKKRQGMEVLRQRFTMIFVWRPVTANLPRPARLPTICARARELLARSPFLPRLPTSRNGVASPSCRYLSREQNLYSGDRLNLMDNGISHPPLTRVTARPSNM